MRHIEAAIREILMGNVSNGIYLSIIGFYSHMRELMYLECTFKIWNVICELWFLIY